MINPVLNVRFSLFKFDPYISSCELTVWLIVINHLGFVDDGVVIIFYTG